MNLASFNTLLLAAVSMAAATTARFSVTPGTPEAVSSSSDHRSYAKQWTLTATTATNGIDSIDLSLVGRVFVSRADGLPSGVIGYVNVSGDSLSIVDSVTVASEKTFGTQKTGGLNVTTNGSDALDGYLLMEVMLSSSCLVWDIVSEQSAQVVIEDGVVATGASEELSIEVSGSSVVRVNAPSTSAKFKDLDLEASGTASIVVSFKEISVNGDASADVKDFASISVLGSSFAATGDMMLEAQNSGKICVAAQRVTAGSYDGETTSKISMPNASNKHGSTGTFACDEAKLLAREPVSVSTSGAISSSDVNTMNMPGSGTLAAAGSTMSSTSVEGDDSGVSDEATSISSSLRCAAAAIGITVLALV